MGKSVADEFGSLLADLTRVSRPKAGALAFGRIERSYEYFGKKEVAEKLGVPFAGASMLFTFDKAAFAHAAHRLEPYKHIPAKKGRAAFEDVGRYMTGDDGPIERYFRTETGPLGPWEPLSYNAIWWRLNNDFQPDPILQASGALHDAVTDYDNMVSIVVTGNYARMVLGPENLTNVEGENVQYKFFTHLLGSLNGFGKGIKIPARPFLPLKPSDLNADERRNIKKIINQAIIANTKVR